MTSPDTHDLVERLTVLADLNSWAPIKADLRQAATLIQDQGKEIAGLRQDVIAFCAPWAVTYAQEHGFTPGHIYPAHYDILERCAHGWSLSPEPLYLEVRTMRLNDNEMSHLRLLARLGATSDEPVFWEDYGEISPSVISELAISGFAGKGRLTRYGGGGRRRTAYWITHKGMAVLNEGPTHAG